MVHLNLSYLKGFHLHLMPKNEVWYDLQLVSQMTFVKGRKYSNQNNQVMKVYIWPTSCAETAHSDIKNETVVQKLHGVREALIVEAH